MKYEQCYELVEYCSETWRACFSPREIAMTAFEIHYALTTSIKNNYVEETILTLLKNLAKDKCDESNNWICCIILELNCASDVWKQLILELFGGER